jgi:hypothetical protein
MGRSNKLARLLGLTLFLTACAHGVDDPLPEDAEKPVQKPPVAPKEEPPVVCTLVKTMRYKDCTIYFFECEDGTSAGAIQCETVPGPFVPEEIPEPYAGR